MTALAKPDDTMTGAQPLDVPAAWLSDAQQRVIFVPWRAEPTVQWKQRFYELAEQWKKETGGLSTVRGKVSHPALEEIIAMGYDVVPLILNELKSDNPGHWFHALHVLTNADPVPDKDHGNIRKMADAWLEWGQNKNLV